MSIVDMRNRLQHFVDMAMEETAGLYPVDRCIIIAEILKRSGFPYEIKKGYINTEIKTFPLCCTYVWLENETNHRIEPIKHMFETHFISERQLPGIPCIDDNEPFVGRKIDQSISNQRDIKRKYAAILKKYKCV